MYNDIVDISKLSEIQLYRFLLDNGFSEQVATNVQDNGIDGAVFNEMTDEQLKEITPRIADRIKLKQPQQSQVTGGKVWTFLSLCFVASNYTQHSARYLKGHFTSTSLM